MRENVWEAFEGYMGTVEGWSRVGWCSEIAQWKMEHQDTRSMTHVRYLEVTGRLWLDGENESDVTYHNTAYLVVLVLCWPVGPLTLDGKKCFSVFLVRPKNTCFFSVILRFCTGLPYRPLTPRHVPSCSIPFPCVCFLSMSFTPLCSS